MKKSITKLASAGSKEDIIKSISKYFCGTIITLVENPDKTFQVHHSYGQIKKFSVTVKTSKKWIGEKFIFGRED